MALRAYRHEWRLPFRLARRSKQRHPSQPEKGQRLDLPGDRRALVYDVFTCVVFGSRHRRQLGDSVHGPPLNDLAGNWRKAKAGKGFGAEVRGAQTA